MTLQTWMLPAMRDVETLLGQLVAIDSVNPDLVLGGAGEAALARFVADWCAAAGLEVQMQEAAPGRPNVIAVARGGGGGRSVMLNAHLDTVGVAGMQAPFAPYVEAGRMYGRGAYDMKSGLAACMIALARARQAGLRGDVYLSAVVDEEYASLGTQAILAEWERWPADAVIVTEPTELMLCVAHKGFVWVEIETHGRAAHGSRPHLGVDAIAKMGRVLTGLENLDRSLRVAPTHPLLHSGSVHAALISGGQEWSSYPAGCKLSLERRTLPGETLEQVRAEIDAILAQAGAEDPDFRATYWVALERAPFEVELNQPIVQEILLGAAQVMGEPPGITGISFWMDAALFAGAGVPTVVFGAVGEGAHAEVEWVNLASVRQCSEVLLATLMAFCG